ncbi:hypothetical protein RFI_31679 [Reticulomyxa filosa]|uniref:RNA polymerase Rpb4/RPC9 core domain-containing protein n=1 Tax=Reticulomyxa filosa TaxID=46433 RepID=X6LYA4_RETFI|nr:hypothetical protein RFI_31679 [Reticulomyxa filosa]|eukprot:ETO05715.1 hypothetical protein RFI_31679 [Reticulomyxa filosa]
MSLSFVEAAALGFQSDFAHAHPLWNSEVAFILENYLEKQSETSVLSGSDGANSSKNNLSNTMIQKTLEYVKKLNTYPTQSNMDMASDLLSKSGKFTPYESALLNNLSIGSVDEAFTLIPSLRDKFPNSDALNTILQQMSDYQDVDNVGGVNNIGNITNMSTMASAASHNMIDDSIDKHVDIVDHDIHFRRHTHDYLQSASSDSDAPEMSHAMYSNQNSYIIYI